MLAVTVESSVITLNFKAWTDRSSHYSESYKRHRSVATSFLNYVYATLQVMSLRCKFCRYSYQVLERRSELIFNVSIVPSLKQWSTETKDFILIRSARWRIRSRFRGLPNSHCCNSIIKLYWRRATSNGSSLESFIFVNAIGFEVPMRLRLER